MLSKYLFKSLLITPAAVAAALMSTSAIAAEVSSVTDSTSAASQDAAVTAQVGTAPTGANVPAISNVPSSVDSSLDAASPVQVPATVAQATPGAVSTPTPASPSAASDSNADLNQIMRYTREDRSTNSMSQVTSISQLSDVQPTDWAFQALQSLVERYGVIAGYPDGTFRGNRALTRYEFAAGLNAALDRVNELIASGLANAVTREDLATLQRLQEEFAAELATLRGRVDSLEARTAELEANQFSTTTVLRGETIFALSTPIDEDRRFRDQATFAYRVRLNFDTSFTGKDRLRARLQVANVNAFAGEAAQGFSYGNNTGGQFRLDDLYYAFPVTNAATVAIWANSGSVDDLITSTISPHDSSGFGSISNFGFPQQYAQGVAGFGGSGAGAGINFQLTPNLTLDAGYVGINNDSRSVSSPAPGSGVFNGNYGAIGQLTYLSDFLDAALTFIHSYSTNSFSIGGLYSVGGPAVANTYGGQVNVKFGRFQVGGGIGYSVVNGIGSRPDYNLWTYQGTIAITDFLGKGNQLGFLAGLPPYTRDLPGQRLPTNILAEAYYRYNLNDNITLTPSVIWVSNPNSSNANDTWIGTLRTTFRF